MSISPGTHVVYTVRPGDTLYKIANQFAASLQTIVEANAFYPPITETDLIYPGQKVLVRLPGMSTRSAVIHQVTEGDTMYHLAERYSVGLELLAGLNQMERPDILRVAQLIQIPAFVYEVEQGDSLFRISRRLGVPLSEIVRANVNRPGFSPDLLYSGYRVIVPLPTSTNIAVLQPVPGTRIAAGEPLIGVARAFEAAVAYQIVDDAGRVVTRARPFTTSAGAPVFGHFQVPIAFDVIPATATGSLMVYTRSARDGSIQDLVEVPVVF